MPVNTDVFFLTTADTPWETYVPAENMEVGQVRYLRRAAQGNPAVGDAGTWRGGRELLQNITNTYEMAETVYIIEGHVRIDTDDGQSFELRTGDAMSFDKGSTVTWTVLSDTFHEFFVFH